ncbi:aminotransferase class V-fold PLP-dependent enzyme [Mycoplasma miroungirhinis]|uniref:Aminotransferase class V-fold PLP-dependent enzyme n=1 Tax=Mycoplasma miroungirhinis TaxID=754516 RepID=A0A6M4JAM3_9MOLU|nr:aminotransferase class V-fold PLP-dependent enzyme [Mycoplasma miroungirhinis]QJR43960.1 aminotransferase class V-fold PLP-dependent enzyme [Mycoplasma miroungirhinis]
MNYKNRFPMLINNPDLVYFDNAALSLKPDVVCEAGNDFYTKYSVSTRTKDSKLGHKTSTFIYQTREKLASLLDADENNVIFTSGSTESLNQIAMMIEDIVEDGDEILFSIFNHASNVLPFFYYLQNKNITYKYFSDQQELLNMISSKTKIICLSQITNNLNIDYNLDEIYQLCLKNDAFLINDAAQAIGYKKVTIKNSDAIIMSANKFYGPTGLGTMIFSKRLFHKLRPKKFGGGASKYLNYTDSLSPLAFEPGTHNYAGIFQLNAALDFVFAIGLENINKKVNYISHLLHNKLKLLDNVILYSKPGDSICLFNVKNVASQDVASYLGNNSIYVRSGTFCAWFMENISEFHGTYVRISLAFYNDESDVDKLIAKLKTGGDFIDYL